ncbi:MAG: hypothetical protein AAF236_08550, partial [Verrucomicrobiota bacterium]
MLSAETDEGTSHFARGRFVFGRNLASNLALMVATVAIGIWFVPYLVRELGEERYGFLPLAANVVMFLSIVTGAFALVATRDLT